MLKSFREMLTRQVPSAGAAILAGPACGGHGPLVAAGHSCSMSMLVPSFSSYYIAGEAARLHAEVLLGGCSPAKCHNPHIHNSPFSQGLAGSVSLLTDSVTSTKRRIYLFIHSPAECQLQVRQSRLGGARRGHGALVAAGAVPAP